MKQHIALTFVLASLSASAFAISPCQEKEQDIQREISRAEIHHNQQRIDGLNKALRQVKTSCNDSKVAADRQQRIAKQKTEIAERRRDLRKAEQKGDAEKIIQHRRKLDKAKQELQALESQEY